MKTTKTLLLLFSFIITNGLYSQKNIVSNTYKINEENNFKSLQNQEIKNLYLQAEQLENSTPQEINAHRLAIKNAWKKIDPDIAKLYKPIVNNSIDNDFAKEIIPKIDTLIEPPSQQNRWANDIQIHNHRVDGGVDIVAFNDGETLFASSFNNNAGGGDYYINIFRSLDQGESWQPFRTVSTVSPTQKIKMLSFEGVNSGDEYLLIYYTNQNNTFRVLRWNLTADEAFDQETITGDVVDFTADRNFTPSTNNLRVFAVYKKTNNNLYSARSNAGSYGFSWMDETYLNANRGQIDLAYGRNGSLYVVMVSDASGSMYVRVNDNYNDPASWSTSDLLENGADRESLNPTISAARLAINQDNVLVVTSSRVAGTSGKYNLRRYIRNNGNDFNASSTEGSPAGISYLFFDSFINYNNGANIQLGLVRYSISGVENNTVYNRSFNGNSLSSYFLASDENLNIFAETFKPYALTSVLTNTGEEPLMVFCNTSEEGSYAQGLYFDKASNILTTPDFENPKILVYPNPADDKVAIEYPIGLQAKSITLYDTSGKRINQNFIYQEDQVVLDISNLKSGLYFIQIETSTGFFTKKLIKK